MSTTATVTDSPEATQLVGEALGAGLAPGAVVALVGGLGAGKTRFVKGLCRGLGVADPDARVTSPTFVLVNEHPARDGMTVFHLDAYRLSGAGELWELGFDEMLDAGGVVVVEWADLVPEAIPAHAVQVRIDPVGETVRRITVTRLDGSPCPSTCRG